MNLSPATTAAHRPRGWVLINLAGLLLGIRQEQVRQIIPAAMLETAPPDVPEAANLFRSGECWPVYALDRELRISPRGGQRFAVFLEALHHPLGLLADAVRILPEDKDLRAQPLPPCMLGGNTPLTGLSLLDGSEVVLIADAQDIACRLQADLDREIG
ncbi:MAG: hypothetical protein KJ558_08495 [Gammaproteobacteria bacterium]|nr:hypothetical protein [Gammaproteobacteria bacterium]MBU1654849.1 hypothetical protein [Gammaproteobacteria bacterium]MBU1961140.1 hypothetical protein [Gammaproteobacteria bacterium]